MSLEKQDEPKLEVFPEAGGVAFATIYSKTGLPINITARAVDPFGAVKSLVQAITQAMAEYEMTTERVIPPAPAQELPITDEQGKPVTDVITGAPATFSLAEGTHLFTVKGIYHDQTKNGKDVLKVVLMEDYKYGKGKYGISCFHPNGFEGWKTWPVGVANLYAAPEGAKHVIVHDPKDGGEYADVVEFRP